MSQEEQNGTEEQIAYLAPEPLASPFEETDCAEELADCLVSGGEMGHVTVTVQGNWSLKSFSFESDNAQSILVRGIMVAGLPVDVGSSAFPLSLLSGEKGIGLQLGGRRPVINGQNITLHFSNVDNVDHHVKATAHFDRMSNAETERLWQRVLTQVAKDMLGKGDQDRALETMSKGLAE